MEKEKSMKVDENLDHLTEYERYCWLMAAHGNAANKEWSHFRDKNKHDEKLGMVWAIMTFCTITALIVMPKYPVFGTCGGAIAIVGCVIILCCTGYPIDNNKRKEFFKVNNVPNFEEYDKQPIPKEMNVDRLYFIVYKFKSEIGYSIWKSHLSEYRGHPAYPIEFFANLEEGDYAHGQSVQFM